MFKKILLAIGLAFISMLVSAQNIEGSLEIGSTFDPLTHATVIVLKTDTATVVAETISDERGDFNFTEIPAGKYILSVTSVGFKDIFRPFELKDVPYNFGKIDVAINAEVLSEIVIDATPPPVVVRNDTTEINASGFKVNPDATTEDLIKKMPGITVDKNGKVTAHGEQVRKITVDGREFFGDDAAATLRNLPSEIVDKIQVFDRLSDQAQLTGFDDGNTSKSINIVTKKNMRQGNFGRVFAGYGTNDTYAAGGNISFFNNDRRISLAGLTNNINQQNFSSEDLAGIGAGSGGYRGGGGFSVGPKSGISKTNALGINYNDKWGDKIEATGSYFFNNSHLQNNRITNTQFLNPAVGNFYDEASSSRNNNDNHNANLRIRYNIDSSNMLLITTRASFQNSNSLSDLLGKMTGQDHLLNISNTHSNLSSNSSAFNVNTGVTFNHKFDKPGRSLSIGFNTTMNRRNGENYNYSLNDYFKTIIVSDTINRFTDQQNHANNYNFSFRYTEPIAPRWQLQLSYSPSVQKSAADQRTFDYDYGHSGYTLLMDSLSNTFSSTYNTQNTGFTIRRSDKNLMLSAGISYQNSRLSSDRLYPTMASVNYIFNNLLGNAMARIKFNNSSQLNLRYMSSVSSPSVTQLQDVINTNNPLFYVSGNADLKQQYTNRLMARYSLTNRETGSSFFANVSVSKMDNYISNASFTAQADSVLSQGIVLHKGSQISRPVNLDGYYSVNSFLNYSIPLTFVKSNLNVNGGFGYSRQPGMINYVENISNNFNYNFGAVLASNVSEYVDFNISYNVNFNNISNSIDPHRNNNYRTQSLGVDLNLLSRKGTFLQTSLSNQRYSGLSSSFDQSYWLWNAAIGQKFLKNQRGELKLSVFDLLKQNQSISRNVTATEITDLGNQVLQQYFMLTFTYKLSNFSKSK